MEVRQLGLRREQIQRLFVQDRFFISLLFSLFSGKTRRAGQPMAANARQRSPRFFLSLLFSLFSGRAGKRVAPGRGDSTALTPPSVLRQRALVEELVHVAQHVVGDDGVAF